jgi:hypothetical protein
MALIFLDGFDKYGGVNSNATSVAALMAGEWTTITNSLIVAALSTTGQAIQNTGNMILSKTLATNYGRIIGGFRFNSNLVVNVGIQFVDNATAQCGIQITLSTGIINFRNGVWNSGTVIAASSASVAASTTHHIEWDITLGNSAAYSIYLDGVSIISGTGDTTATANNTISVVQLVTANSGLGTFDDLYLFDSTGTINNAPLLTSPRIETTLPISDSAVQFSIGASVLAPGGTAARVATSFGTSNNQFYVRPATPPRSCTLNSITLVPNSTISTTNIRPVIYGDSSGAPGTLLSAGSTVTGLTTGTPITMPLTAPQSLTAGTQYWLGFMLDAGFPNMQISDGNTSGRSGTATFTSGAPGTAPSTTAGTASVLLWGNITLAAAVNFYQVSQQTPPAANTSYVSDTTTGHEDFYGFPNLSVTPASIYAVAVKAYCARSDSGARTVSLRMSSGGTDSGGSLAGQSPGTSYAWIGSNFATDPNGSIAWTGTALNAATTGFKIDA